MIWVYFSLHFQSEFQRVWWHVTKSEDLKELVKMWHARDIRELNLYSCFEKGDWATIVIHSSGTRMVSVILISSGIQGPIILTQPVVPWQLMSWDPFYSHGLTLIPASISNHTSSRVWDEIIYAFPDFNDATIEVCKWISNFIPHFRLDVITNPCWDLS